MIAEDLVHRQQGRHKPHCRTHKVAPLQTELFRVRFAHLVDEALDLLLLLALRARKNLFVGNDLSRDG